MVCVGRANDIWFVLVTSIGSEVRSRKVQVDKPLSWLDQKPLHVSAMLALLQLRVHGCLLLWFSTQASQDRARPQGHLQS